MTEMTKKTKRMPPPNPSRAAPASPLAHSPLAHTPVAVVPNFLDLPTHVHAFSGWMIEFLLHPAADSPGTTHQPGR
jgi:hypothetical protein